MVALRLDRLVRETDRLLTGGPGADVLIALGGNDELYANDGAADTQIDCDGGTRDIAHLDGTDPASSGCETVGP